MRSAELIEMLCDRGDMPMQIKDANGNAWEIDSLETKQCVATFKSELLIKIKKQSHAEVDWSHDTTGV